MFLIKEEKKTIEHIYKKDYMDLIGKKKEGILTYVLVLEADHCGHKVVAIWVVFKDKRSQAWAAGTLEKVGIPCSVARAEGRTGGCQY